MLFYGITFLKGRLFIISKFIMKSFMRIGSFSCPLQFDTVNNIKVELIRIYTTIFFKQKIILKNKNVWMFFKEWCTAVQEKVLVEKQAVLFVIHKLSINWAVGRKLKCVSNILFITQSDLKKINCIENFWHDWL